MTYLPIRLEGLQNGYVPCAQILDSDKTLTAVCPNCLKEEQVEDAEKTLTCEECAGVDMVVMQSSELQAFDTKQPATQLESIRNVVVPNVVKLVSNRDDADLRLGHLYPADKFQFVRDVPLDDVDLNTSYVIVPSKRGYVAFTDRFFQVHRLDKSCALLYKIKLLSSENIDPDQRLHHGDRIKRKNDGRKGMVLGPKGAGFTVRLINSSSEGNINWGEEVWEAPSNLSLINKARTTRSYVREDNGEWQVSVGDHHSTHESMLSALKYLKDLHRPAFYRYSKYLCMYEISVQEEVRSWLIKVDQRVWGKCRA